MLLVAKDRGRGSANGRLSSHGLNCKRNGKAFKKEDDDEYGTAHCFLAQCVLPKLRVQLMCYIAAQYRVQMLLRRNNLQRLVGCGLFSSAGAIILNFISQ